MEYQSGRIRVPGKLIIAGEYAVLESGQPSIVVGIDRYVTVDIHEDEQYMLSQAKYGIEDLVWKINKLGQVEGLEEGMLCFIKDAITITFQYLKEKGIPFHPFHIKVTSDLDDIGTGKKYGLGSSAAVVVGIIGAILYYFQQIDFAADLSILYRVAIISHLKTQGNGSGADIAAAVYGGWISYSRYQIEWLIHQIARNIPLQTLVAVEWPDLSIQSIDKFDELILAVGWTQNPAKTGPMISKIEVFKNESPKDYETFLMRSKESVNRVMGGLRNKEPLEILEGIGLNRQALQFLGKRSNVEIETKELSRLCNIADCYGGGKSSGAGGGDCGIAILFNPLNRIHLVSDWNNVNILELDLKVSERGIHLVID